MTFLRRSTPPPMTSGRGGAARARILGGARCILIVEDTNSVRELVVGALAGDGFFVREATSVDDALEELACAEIVLTDFELGNRSGLELIEVIAKRFPALPVIAMSGNRALLQEATRAGAIAVLGNRDLGQLRVAVALARVAAAASGS
jgi:DNA-binding NtrC family response regulator